MARITVSHGNSGAIYFDSSELVEYNLHLNYLYLVNGKLLDRCVTAPIRS